MNHTHLAWRLGLVGPAAFQRYQHERLVHSLTPQPWIAFDARSDSSRVNLAGRQNLEQPAKPVSIAHQAGVNSLAISNNGAGILISGGADASIHLWDLEARESNGWELHISHPSASLTRTASSSHTHAITSLSIYPFDPIPTTLLSTAHDKTFKLTSITPSSLKALHTFPLEFAPYAHSISPVPSTSPLIAVGTAHPAIRLFDLRSGLGTHSLPGHNGAVYSLAWSPKIEHILASGSADSRVLFFDVRRANAAFATLDLDDAIGVIGDNSATGAGSRAQLEWNARAHNGPVTGVQWTPTGDKIVTAGHDQRIRVWDASTGRNDLVHFGPRIRNERTGELKPLISPIGCGKPGKEVLLWPNDDGKGDIFMHSLREGEMLRILHTEGVNRGQAQAQAQSRQGAIGKLTSGGRINAMVWRYNADHGAGIEMYSAHGDGRVCLWAGRMGDEEEIEEDEGTATGAEELERLRKKKRKRDLVGDLVEGLTKRPVTFS